MLKRRGFSLLEMIIAIAMLAVLSIVIMTAKSAAAQTNTVDDDVIEKAARTLSDLSEAIGLYTNVKAAKVSSFFQIVGSNPHTLSQLTTPITTSDRNSCGPSSPVTNSSLYTSSQVGVWAGQFFRQPLPTAGFLIATGFFADDTLKRYSTTFNPSGPPYFSESYLSTNDKTTPGTLAIVIRNVTVENAAALAQRFEGDLTGVRGAVRYDNTAPAGSLVTVEFHINIHGC